MFKISFSYLKNINKFKSSFSSLSSCSFFSTLTIPSITSTSINNNLSHLKDNNKENETQSMTPNEIVSYLDKYIIGQKDAKKAVAVAFRNRWRRQKLPIEIKNEVIYLPFSFSFLLSLYFLLFLCYISFLFFILIYYYSLLDYTKKYFNDWSNWLW